MDTGMQRTCIVCGAELTRRFVKDDDRFAFRQTCSAVCAAVLGDDDLLSDKRPGRESSADADETDRPAPGDRAAHGREVAGDMRPNGGQPAHGRVPMLRQDYIDINGMNS